MTLTALQKAPFPWFGGKRKAAPLVWSLLGDVDHYVEPFTGTLAVLLERPHPCNRTYYSETVNDRDGLLVNAWRSIQMHPEATADAASWPVTEADKTARQLACLAWVAAGNVDRLAGDWRFCDPVVGGLWLWSVCAQIGAFTGDGPWIVDPASGRIVKQGKGPRLPGVSRDLPHLGNNGRGVNHAGTREPGVTRDLPHLSSNGQGVNHAGTREPGVSAPQPEPDSEFHPITMPELTRWFRWLSARLRHVRVLNGDWARLVTTGASHTLAVRQGGHAGIFLDPPYLITDNRADNLYAHDSDTVAHKVREWAVGAGANPRNRIVIAGFDTEHTDLETHGWTVHEWFTDGYLTGGMGQRNGGGHQMARDRLWASPHCQDPEEAIDAALW